MPPLSVLALGVATALANLLGGILVAANRRPSEKLLLVFMGFGGGFILGAAFLEMVPESLEGATWAPLLVAAGYLMQYVIEFLFAHQAHTEEETTTLAHSHEVAHVHKGADPASGHVSTQRHLHPPSHTITTEFPEAGQLISPSASLAALIGFLFHDFLDGLAIAAAFITNPSLGTLVFFAVLAHEVPAGLSLAAVMRAGGYPRWAALASAGGIGIITIVGLSIPYILGLSEGAWITAFLAMAAGTFIYVAASDLLPAIGPPRSRQVILYVLTGVGIYYGSARLIEGLVG